MGFYADNIFPLLLDILTTGLRPQCKKIAQDAPGRVLEIGIGTGANLPFYTSNVGEVIGTDPSLTLLEKAQRRLQQLTQQSEIHPRVTLQPGSAFSTKNSANIITPRCR